MYMKIVLDGKTVDVHKRRGGAVPLYRKKLLKIRGCHQEMATEEEYATFKAKQTKIMETQKKPVKRKKVKP